MKVSLGYIVKPSLGGWEAICVEEWILEGYQASIPFHLLPYLTLARQEGTEAQCQPGLPSAFLGASTYTHGNSAAPDVGQDS